MAKELQVKEFSDLPVADDGKTLLYADGEVKQSRKNLSEMLTDEVNNKLDTTAFSTVSGSFLTAHQVIPSGKWENVSDVVIANSATWETETDWTDDINAASAYAYEQAVAQIPAPFDPSFLSGEIDKKLDTTAFSTVSGDFLTNEDLNGYVTDNTFNTTTNYLSGAIDYVSANAKDIYPVYATYGASITFDKTYDEIYSAINSNKLPIVYFTNYDNRVKCTYTFGGNSSKAPLYFTSNYITYPVGDEKALYSYTLELLSDNTVTFTQAILNQTKLDNVYDTVNTNSASWGGGSTTGEYVPLSATACSIGNNTATATQSFSQGVNNQGLGTESFTQGYGNSAYNGALAQGRECYASNYSIAQGSNCSALVSPGQAFGQGTVISSVGMVIGQYNKTSANVSFVIGNGVASNRSDLFVIDKYGNVSAKSGYFYDKDGKVGGGTTYKGGYLISIDNSHKLNFINYNCHNDSAKYNVAIGCWTTAVGSASVAMGQSTSAFGDYSHAEGYQTTADGQGSHADGSNTKAIGDYSLAVGLCTSAKGSYSHAGGKYTIANYEYQVVIGKYNDNKADTLFEIGNGNYDTRTNALEVYADGKVSAGDFVAGGVSLSSLTPVTLTFRTVGE